MQSRIDSLDTIRFVAMLLMIVCHACDPFNAGATYGTGETDPTMFFWGSVWGSCVRACVPLFVMLTGVLCLRSQLPMQTFWRRRISRVLWPFLIWSAIYNLFPWFVALLGLPESTVYDFFVWAGDPSGDLTTCLKRVLAIPYRFDSLACHTWYVYALIGLYLYIPILAAWVRQTTRRQQELVLALWLLSTCLPYMHEYVATYLFGECEWNSFGLFYYFSGFTGYLLLGYYITVYVPMRIKPALVFSIPAFVLGAVVTWKGFTHITALPAATPEQMELYWQYCSPNVVLMTTAVFLTARLIPTGGRVKAALANFTVCGFGIYMAHYLLVGPMYSLVTALHIPVALQVPVSALLILFATWAFVAAVKHVLPRSQWLMG